MREGKVTGFNPILVAENFAEEGAGAGGEFLIFWGVGQSRKNFGLGESAGGNGSADGVEEHRAVGEDKLKLKLKKGRGPDGWAPRGFGEVGGECGC